MSVTNIAIIFHKFKKLAREIRKEPLKNLAKTTYLSNFSCLKKHSCLKVFLRERSYGGVKNCHGIVSPH